MPQTPYNRALDLLSARPYSVRALRRKLLQREVPADEVDAVVERLLGAGLLDDAGYALAYARSRMTGAGSSARRVRQELSRKGIAAEIAAPAVEQVIADEEIDTRAVIERIARKKLATLGELEPPVIRRRLYAFLARRGYDLDEIQAVLRGIAAQSE